MTNVYPKNDIQVACIVPLHSTDVDTISAFLKRLPERITEVYLSINDKELLGKCNFETNARKGVFVLEIPFQVGKLEAYRCVMEQILTTTKCNLVAQADGRLKQPPEELDNLIDALLQKDYGMVVADRYANQDMSGQNHRIAIANMLQSIISAITPYSLNDIVCGTRVYKKDVAHLFLNLKGFGYGLEVEQMLICALHKVDVASVPVSSNRQHDITNSEKIEDVLYAIISYCGKLSVPKDIRQLLCYMLVQVKKRNDFEINLNILNKIGYVLWKYTASNKNNINGVYSTQTPDDGYSLYIHGM